MGAGSAEDTEDKGECGDGEGFRVEIMEGVEGSGCASVSIVARYEESSSFWWHVLVGRFTSVWRMVTLTSIIFTLEVGL